MRILLLCSTLLLAATAAEANAPVGLDPFATSLRFSEALRAVPADHPLYRRLEIEPLQGMPARVGTPFSKFTDPAEFASALRDGLASANMAAPAPGDAKARLVVTWLGLDAPMKISAHSEAVARLRYELKRTDSGETIFARDIVTQAKARGGSAADRLKGTARAAIAANLASALLCLDKAATGMAPADCALQVGGGFDAPITRPVARYR